MDGNVTPGKSVGATERAKEQKSRVILWSYTDPLFPDILLYYTP